MTAPLADFKALTFDCYGTLIDWESGIWDALQPLLAANRRDDVTRLLALEAFSDIESKQQAETPRMLYPQILHKVHEGISARFDLKTTPQLNAAFENSIAHWPAFPDSADALRFLKKHYKLVILSNVHRDGFAASNRKLGVTFDAIYTAEDIGSYKPDAANFDYMLERLREEEGLEGGDILHTAQSLFHDHGPAKAHGLANAWIDRQRLSEHGSWGATARVEQRPETDFLYFSMEEMAEAVRSAWDR